MALVDGLAPLLSSAMVLLPFFLTRFWGSIVYSYYLAVAIALITLFGLGAFLGRISRTNIFIAGLKMITAGLASLLLSYLLDDVLQP